MQVRTWMQARHDPAKRDPLMQGQRAVQAGLSRVDPVATLRTLVAQASDVPRRATPSLQGAPARVGRALAPDDADAALREQLRALPKVELHVHLEGSLPPAFLLALARRNRVALPYDTPQAFHARRRYRDFRDFAQLLMQGAVHIRASHQDMNIESGRQAVDRCYEYRYSLPGHSARRARHNKCAVRNAKLREILGFARIQFRLVTFVYCHRYMAPQTEAGHAQVEQIAAYGLANADDAIDPRVQEIQPGLWAPVGNVANDAAVSDQFDVHSYRGHEPVHGRALVQHMQYVVLPALQFIANKTNAGQAELPLQDIGDSWHAGSDQGIVIDRARPGDHGNIDAHAMHFDE